MLEKAPLACKRVIFFDELRKRCEAREFVLDTRRLNKKDTFQVTVIDTNRKRKRSFIIKMTQWGVMDKNHTMDGVQQYVDSLMDKADDVLYFCDPNRNYDCDRCKQCYEEEMFSGGIQGECKYTFDKKFAKTDEEGHYLVASNNPYKWRSLDD